MTIWDDATRFLYALLDWREARGEPTDGQIAVAWCVRNRVERPSWWGTDYYSVITKRLQFSSLTDPKDPQLTKWPVLGDKSFDACANVTWMVMQGMVQHPFPGADSYFDSSIPPPYWANPAQRLGQIGRLTFYDIDRDHETVPTMP